MNIIKRLLLNTFGDGFFGLERDQNIQEEITNGYREYQKKHKKPEKTCYSILYGDGIGTCTLYESPQIFIGSCASISNTTGQNNTAIGSAFIESHLE
jgi:hypothetical protein